MRSLALKAFFLFTFLVILPLPGSVFADTLLIAPSSGDYTEGQTFSVRVLLTSTGQSVNAVSGVLDFPRDILQVVSVAKTGSMLTLWVQEPSFSNAKGTVTFEGVVPNPGFIGSNGRIITVNFRALKSGTAELKLLSGSILANDGQGTDILRTLGSASFSIAAIPVVEPEIQPREAEYPIAPLVQIPVVESSEESPKTLTFNIPSLSSVYEWLLKFLSVIVPLVALVFFLIHTTKRGVGNIRGLRKNMRKDLRTIEHIVDKSFDIIKEDISESIHSLERARSKRKLTAEEDAIIHRLRQNLVDAEKIIQEEISHAEKDIGD